jgi:hypothetical protein
MRFDIGGVVQQRLEQRYVIVRVVLEIGVLVHEHVTGRERPEVLDHAATADVLRHEDDLGAWQLQAAQDVARAVVRAIVADEHFELEAGIHRHDRIEQPFNRGALVVNRN